MMFTAAFESASPCTRVAFGPLVSAAVLVGKPLRVQAYRDENGLSAVMKKRAVEATVAP